MGIRHNFQIAWRTARLMSRSRTNVSIIVQVAAKACGVIAQSPAVSQGFWYQLRSARASINRANRSNSEIRAVRGSQWANALVDLVDADRGWLQKVALEDSERSLRRVRRDALRDAAQTLAYARKLRGNCDWWDTCLSKGEILLKPPCLQSPLPFTGIPSNGDTSRGATREASPRKHFF